MAEWPIVLAHQLRTGDVILAVALGLLTSCLGYYTLRVVGLARQRGYGEAYARFAWQLGVLLGLEQAYELARGRISHQTAVAFLNAYRLLDLEWRHGFFIESRVQRFFLQSQPVMNAVDLFYVLAHLLVTIGVLIWLWAHRRHCYPFVRNMLVITTALALISFYVYPTAPPRMLAQYGFVDPLISHHLVAAGGEQPGSYTYNPYAAMPSLHVAYALIVSWGILLAERRVWIKMVAVLYPCAMAAAVIISGNHWVLDVVGAVMTVLIARLILFSAAAGYALLGSFASTFVPLLRRRRAMRLIDS